jgi:hypothetical protein
VVAVRWPTRLSSTLWLITYSRLKKKELPLSFSSHYPFSLIKSRPGRFFSIISLSYISLIFLLYFSYISLLLLGGQLLHRRSSQTLRKGSRIKYSLLGRPDRTGTLRHLFFSLSYLTYYHFRQLSLRLPVPIWSA